MHTYYVYVNVKIMTVLLNNEHVLIMRRKRLKIPKG